MPFEFMKKTMMTGIGIALRTQTEIEAMARDFIQQNRMSEEEGEKFVDEISKKYEESKKKLEDRVETLVTKVIKKADIASRSEIEALKQEVAELRKKIES